MKQYDEKQVRENISSVMHKIEDCVRQSLQDNPFNIDRLPPMPEIYCRNCGRSVYVGRCCASPDITEEGKKPTEDAIVKEATDFADNTVIREDGESFPSYFLRKVKVRREKIEELRNYAVVEFTPVSIVDKIVIEGDKND